MSLIGYRYLLQQELGRGGMGVVHQAFDQLTGQIVALKRLTVAPRDLDLAAAASTMNQEQLSLALAHEFQMLASLRHPHIISVLDYGFDQEMQPYFTMPYLANTQNLTAACQTIDDRNKFKLMVQILQALAYLHRQRMVHHDLKPANVLVSEGHARILDFGLAVRQEHTGFTGGSWRYLAPELMQGGTASVQSDLYSFGIIIYELLTGHLPYSGRGSDYLSHVLYQSPDLRPLREKYGYLIPLIGRLLSKTPTSRYPDAETTLNELVEATRLPAPEESIAIRESYLQAATFVGRQQEMATLLAALDRAQAGQGSAWLVGGESGVGKSRLLDELRIGALGRGIVVLRGQATASAQGAPYQLWRDALRHLVLLTHPDDLAAAVLKPLLPDLETLLNRPIPPEPPLDPQPAEERRYGVIIDLFRQAKRPILFLLEDLQWASTSLELSQQLGRQVSRLPVLVVASYRQDERPGLPEELPDFHTLALQRLQKAEIAQLSESMLGQIGRRAPVLNFLQRETEGNAFFLVETVRALAEEAGRLSAIGEMALPERVLPKGVQAIINRRLNQIPAVARPLLNLAATAGRQLDLAVIAALGQALPLPLTVEMWLQLCAEAAVLTVAEAQWRFSHDKLRENLLAALTPAERKGCHAQVAQALEQLYAQRPDYAAALADHWREAGDVEKERHYALLAGDFALKHAHNEAERFLSQALALTSVSAVEKRFEILMKRVQLYNHQGNRPAQAADLRRLSQLAQALNPVAQSEIALRRSDLAEATGDYEKAATFARQAIELAQQSRQPDGRQEASGRLALGSAYFRLGDYEQAKKELQRGLTLGRQLADHLLEFKALQVLSTVADYQADFELARRHAQAALAICRRENYQLGEVLSLNILANVTKNFARRTAHYQAALALTRKIGYRRSECNLLNNLGHMSETQGNLGQALHYYEQALAVAQTLNDRLMIGVILANQGFISYEQGHYSVAGQAFEKALLHLEAINNPRVAAFVWRGLGDVHLKLAEFETAAAAYERSLAIRQSVGQPHLVQESRAGLAQVYLKQGRPEQALAQVEQILNYIDSGSSIYGTDESFIYLGCYQVLEATGDERSRAILQIAYTHLQEKAQAISDPESRRAFLEEMSANRALLAAWEEARG